MKISVRTRSSATTQRCDVRDRRPVHLVVKLSEREASLVRDAIHHAVWESSRFFNPGRVVPAIRILKQLGSYENVVHMLEDALLDWALP